MQAAIAVTRPSYTTIRTAETRIRSKKKTNEFEQVRNLVYALKNLSLIKQALERRRIALVCEALLVAAAPQRIPLG